MINRLNTELIKRAEGILANSGLGLSLKIEEISGDLQACFNKRDQTVSLNLRKIIRNAQMEQLEVCDYMEMILCHELGHALDPQLTLETMEEINLTRDLIDHYLEKVEVLKEGQDEYDNIMEKLNFHVNILEKLEYSAEERACTLGLRYVPKHLNILYAEHSRIILETYKMNYEYLKKNKNEFLQ